MPSDVNAAVNHDLQAGLAHTRVAAKAAASPPLPRSVGLMIAFGVSLVMWAALIEAGFRFWWLVGGR